MCYVTLDAQNYKAVFSNTMMMTLCALYVTVQCICLYEKNFDLEIRIYDISCVKVYSNVEKLLKKKFLSPPKNDELAHYGSVYAETYLHKNIKRY